VGYPALIDAKRAEALRSGNTRERFDGLIDRLADTGEVWALAGRHGFVLAQGTGKGLIPLWPHHVFASENAVQGWAETEPILLRDEDLEGLLEQADVDGFGFLAFPMPGSGGIQVDAEALVEAVNERAQ
jgi:hypothetical protein